LGFGGYFFYLLTCELKTAVKNKSMQLGRIRLASLRENGFLENNPDGGKKKYTFNSENLKCSLRENEYVLALKGSQTAII